MVGGQRGAGWCPQTFKRANPWDGITTGTTIARVLAVWRSARPAWVDGHSPVGAEKTLTDDESLSSVLTRDLIALETGDGRLF